METQSLAPYQPNVTPLFAVLMPKGHSRGNGLGQREGGGGFLHDDYGFRLCVQI